MTAMILAAGRGERLRPITDTIPKALVEVRGRSLIERHLDRLAAIGVGTVVINLGWHGEKIVERVGSGDRFGLQVLYSREGEDILETGGGIHKALPMLGVNPFLVVNADVFTDMPLPTTLPPGADGHLVLVPRPAHRNKGDFDLADGKVQTGESPAYTFSGVAVYRPELFSGCRPGRFPLAPILRRAADEGVLTGEVYHGFWEDIGTPERLAAVNRE